MPPSTESQSVAIIRTAAPWLPPLLPPASFRPPPPDPTRPAPIRPPPRRAQLRRPLPYRRRRRPLRLLRRATPNHHPASLRQSARPYFLGAGSEVNIISSHPSLTKAHWALGFLRARLDPPARIRLPRAVIFRASGGEQLSARGEQGSGLFVELDTGLLRNSIHVNGFHEIDCLEVFHFILGSCF